MNENRDMWDGACFETRGQTRVFGLQLAKAFCRFMGVPLKPRESIRLYRFGCDK